MPQPSLIQVLGTGASQDVATLTIQKSALATVGLSPTAENTAESLITAILLLAAMYLNPTNQTTNPDIQITIADSGFPQIVNRENQQYRQTTYNVNFQKIDNNTGLDPDDF